MREFLRTRLGRELAAVVAVKLVLLYALWAAFFAAPPTPDAAAIARALAPPPQSSAGSER